MEAALKRSGRNVDLSEDTLMYFVKQFWLSSIDGKPADTCENQVGGWDGGNGVENLAFLAGGLAVPEESSGRPDGHRYKVPLPWQHDRWKSQFNVDSWNLSPHRLLPAALRARSYFTITGYRSLSNPKDTSGIEQALAQGHEVVWDFKIGGTRPGDGIWHYNGPPKGDSDQHSVLIVGYDRRDSGRPYFIIKDSHGPTKTPGANGFTYVGYDFLQYGRSAGFLIGVRQVAWPELRFLGRWEIVFDGQKGLLDISHIPGVFRGVYEQHHERKSERRIGTFYYQNDPTKAARVNGSIQGNRIDFYVDWSNSNPGLDKCGGRHFEYYLSEGNDGLMSGLHRDPDGTVYGGFAQRLESDDAFPSEAKPIDAAQLPEMQSYVPSDRLGRTPTPESYLGDWTLRCQAEPIAVHLTQRDDSVVPAARQEEFAGLTGEGITAFVNKRDPRKLELVVTGPDPDHTKLNVQVRLLGWERGITAGIARISGQATKLRFGAIMTRGHSAQPTTSTQARVRPESLPAASGSSGS